MAALLQTDYYKTIHQPVLGARLTLYFCLQNTCRIQLPEEEILLKENDFCVINPGCMHTISCTDSLLVQIKIAPGLLADQEKISYIECSSLKESSENIERLRRILHQYLHCSEHTQIERLRQQRFGMELVIFLLSYFTSNSLYQSQSASRKQQIEQYLLLHYQEDLSLDDISAAFGFSPPYFSKIFKETFGQSFVKYLTGLRVQASQPLLENSDLSVLAIALECGFSNLNAYNIAFKNTFGISPGAWRKEQQNTPALQKASAEEVQKVLEQSEENDDADTITARCSVRNPVSKLDPYWFYLLNLGKISDLLSERNQRFLKEIVTGLPFQYGRLFLEIPRTHSSLYFDEEEAVFDLLYHLHLKPWIVLDYRELEHNPAVFDWFEEFLSYFTNRYGEKNTGSWKFEVYYNSDFTEPGSETYDAFCRKINTCLQQAGLETQAAGPGLQINENALSIHAFCAKNTQIREMTVTLTPLIFKTAQDTLYMERRTSRDSFLQDLQRIQQAAGEYGIHTVIPISWKDSLFEKDILNDSSYRAARLIQACLMAYGTTPALPIEKPFYPSSYHQGLFAGDAGLLSPKDIRKPAFYALKFLKHLDDTILYRSDQCIISASGTRYLQIILHHCAHLSYQYYLSEGQQDTDVLPKYFEEEKPLHFHLEISGMDPGEYIVKEKTIGTDQGNAYFKYGRIRFENPSFFGPNEMNFLQAASIPEITGHQVKAEDGNLCIDVTLQPNEVRHLHILISKKTRR